MPEIETMILVALVAGAWGAAGGFIYWATPPAPKGATPFLQRVGIGFVAGAVANVLGPLSPFQ